MSGLTIIKNDNGLMVDSRDVAGMVERQHDALMKSIRQYCEYLAQGDFDVSSFFTPSTYKDTTGRTLPCFMITRRGCDMVANKMTGEKGTCFTATYVTKFEEMENNIKNAIKDSYMIEDPIKRAQAWIVEAEERKSLTLQIEEQMPKVIFAKALEVSKNSILIRELATIAKQNGVVIGQNRLFEKLREDGYLIKRGDCYNQPTQKSMNLGLMEIFKRFNYSPNGSAIFMATTKITGKGQIYFINKLLKGSWSLKSVKEA